MKPFIRTDQYNYIKLQIRNLISGHATSNDAAVIDTLKSMAFERVLALFSEATEQHGQLFDPITQVKDKEDGEKFLSQIKPFVIPFKVSEQGIKKLFPKVKKLKVPSLEDENLLEICYLSWMDSSTNKKYIVTYRNEKLVGLEGDYQPLNKKGICTICNGHEDVGLYQVKKKGVVQGNYSTKGNYICHDSHVCNQNITSLEKLHGFVDILRK